MTLIEKATELLGDIIPEAKEVYKVSRVHRFVPLYGLLPCPICGEDVGGRRVRVVSLRWRGTLWKGKNERLIHESHFEEAGP